MITDKKEMEKSLEEIESDVYPLIDNLDICNDDKIRLKNSWVLYKKIFDVRWNLNH